MNFHLAAAVAIFAATLFMVIKKPGGLGIGYSALMGAAVTILLGITTLSDVLEVWNIVWNATFTLVALIVLSVIFDEAGFFEYVSVKVLKIARGNGFLLYLLIILLGALVSAFFANDGNVLVLTPIVYSLLKRINVDGERMVAFLMTLGFVADSTSLPFVVSNLVNIVTASYFSFPFLNYLVVMAIPDIVSIAASTLFLWVVYRRHVKFTYDPSNLRPVEIRDRKIFRIAAPFMVAIVAAYSLSGVYEIPVALIAVPAVAMVAIAAYLNGKIDVVLALREAPWQVVLFSLGMYIVVFGMGREGITQALASLIVSIQNYPGPFPVVLTGLLISFIAAILNNMPSVMMVNLSLAQAGSPQILAYANVIANDIGPKFTTIGSLATLMWLEVLRKKEMDRISPLYYTKIGLAVGLPVLVITLLSLWLVFPLVS